MSLRVYHWNQTEGMMNGLEEGQFRVYPTPDDNTATHLTALFSQAPELFDWCQRASATIDQYPELNNLSHELKQILASVEKGSL